MTDNKENQEALVIDETSYKTELTKKYRKRKPWTPPDSRKIVAFLPGTIKNVLVKKGDRVTKGQTVVKFEAMKMINNVQSPIDGIVKEVNAVEGNNFSKGFVLVELE